MSGIKNIVPIAMYLVLLLSMRHDSCALTGRAADACRPLKEHLIVFLLIMFCS
jgi:hypothetical protein